MKEESEIAGIKLNIQTTKIIASGHIIHGKQMGKEYTKVLYCHPAYLTYMQSTSCEMRSWMNHKLESRLLGEISITSDMQMTPPRGSKEPLDESESGE